MGYCYGKGNVIGKMNDEWYVARIRIFLIQYSKAIEQQQGRCVIVYTDESYVNVNTRASLPGTTPTRRRRTTWSDLVARASAWCCCTHWT